MLVNNCLDLNNRQQGFYELHRFHDHKLKLIDIFGELKHISYP
jgi:hypothetical protein